MLGNNPTACAILLTADRPAMARRAVESFRAQTYTPKALLIYDTGHEAFLLPDLTTHEHIMRSAPRVGDTIGRLRNEVASVAKYPILINWDDDDWSSPTRIAEQVDLLQSSGADVCGYNETLFWPDIPGLTKVESRDNGEFIVPRGGEAWLYTDHRPDRAIGSSLCYARAFWEKHPFADGPKPGVASEYWDFLRAGKTVAVSSLADEPRLICSIHGANSNMANYNQLFAAAGEGRTNSWTRAPQFDEYCRGVFSK